MVNSVNGKSVINYFEPEEPETGKCTEDVIPNRCENQEVIFRNEQPSVLELPHLFSNIEVQSTIKDFPADISAEELFKMANECSKSFYFYPMAGELYSEAIKLDESNEEYKTYYDDYIEKLKKIDEAYISTIKKFQLPKTISLVPNEKTEDENSSIINWLNSFKEELSAAFKKAEVQVEIKDQGEKTVYFELLSSLVKKGEEPEDLENEDSTVVLVFDVDEEEAEKTLDSSYDLGKILTSDTKTDGSFYKSALNILAHLDGTYEALSFPVHFEYGVLGIINPD